MRLSLGLIFAGTVFFALPNFNMFDIMPDFIGAILIMSGLSKLQWIDGNFEDARKGAKYLLWVSVLRLVLCVFANGGRADYLVPFTFIVCVLEIMFMMKFFRNLYLGLEYTLTRSDCERHIKASGEAFTMSFIFVIAQKVMEFIPYTCDIVKQDAELSVSGDFTKKLAYAQMKPYILGACIICGVLLGLVFICVTARGLFGIIRDKKYAAFLKEKCDNFLEVEREKHLSSVIVKSYFFFTLSLVFIFNFYIDGINVLPSAMIPVLLVCAIVSLKRFSDKNFFLPILTGTVLAIVSLAGYVFMTKVHFGRNYIYANESFGSFEFAKLESTAAITEASVFAIAELILTCILVFMCLSRMGEIFKREKRKVALPMLKVAFIPVFLSCLTEAVRKILTVIETHLATNDDVLGYIRNKATIKSVDVYNEYMQNPLIVNFERVSGAAYYCAFISAILVLASIVYMLRIRRFTDGEDKK